MKTITRRILLVCGSLFAIMSLMAQSPDATKAQARDALNSGVAAFKNGNPQLAADSFIQALKLDPELTAAELYLGTTYASMATPQSPELARKAIESFERVLQKQPDNQEAISRLASMYLRDSDHAKARTLYLHLTKAAPQDATAFYSLAAVDWTIAMNKTNPLPDADRRIIVDEGLQSVDVALTLNPQYEDAMVYRNLLLRQKAELTSDPADRAKLIAEADTWFAKALEIRRQNAPATAGAISPAPGPAPATVRIGSAVAQASLVRNVAPVYPPLAQAARVQGVVMLQTSIDKAGQVVGVSVISGHPLLNDAAVEAVQQWSYRPIMLNGQPIDAVTTVTVNFSMQ